MRPKNEIRFGFLIKNNRIFDTKIQSYSIKKVNLNGLIIYRMFSSNYKRLSEFEWMIKENKDNNFIFNFLKNNINIQKQRKKEINVNDKTLINASNMSVVYRYPPKYLNKKKFYLYKSCQILKKKLN